MRVLLIIVSVLHMRRDAGCAEKPLYRIDCQNQPLWTLQRVERERIVHHRPFSRSSVKHGDSSISSSCVLDNFSSSIRGRNSIRKCWSHLPSEACWQIRGDRMHWIRNRQSRRDSAVNLICRMRHVHHETVALVIVAYVFALEEDVSALSKIGC